MILSFSDVCSFNSLDEHMKTSIHEMSRIFYNSTEEYCNSLLTEKHIISDIKVSLERKSALFIVLACYCLHSSPKLKELLR